MGEKRAGGILIQFGEQVGEVGEQVLVFCFSGQSRQVFP